MKHTAYHRMLAWLAVAVALIGFSLPWATYGVMADSTLTYQTWTGWHFVAALFLPGAYGPFALLVAAWLLAPLWVAGIVAFRSEQRGKPWPDALLLAFAIGTIGFETWMALDTPQGFNEGTPPPMLGLGLLVLLLSVVLAGAARWWHGTQQSKARLTPAA